MTVNLNGDMSQWTMGNAAAPDMFRLHDTSAAVHTIAQSDDVPSFSLCGRVIHHSMEITVATADASLGAADLTAITYRGEGSELCYLLGGPVRVRLWLKGIAGTYNLHLSNGAETWSYSQPLTLQASDMWTRFDVFFTEIPYADTDWYLDHRVGYTVALTLANGTSSQDEMEKWISPLKFGGPQTNFNATVGNKLKIAGLRVGDGPLFYEAPEQIKQDCRRYLRTSFEDGVTPADNVGNGTGELTFPAQFAGAQVQQSAPVSLSPMRKVPTMTGKNPSTGTAGQARAFNAGACTGTTFDQKTSHGFRALATTPAGATVGETIGLHWLADAALPALTQNVGG